MSNIIVLSGSPRKGGNTDLLVDAFVKGAEKNNNVEVISVADYKVNPCIGCNSCFDREGHDCFQQDDMQVVYDKLKCADVIVVASPVYFYGVSAQLKAIIDRLHTPMGNDFKARKLQFCQNCLILLRYSISLCLISSSLKMWEWCWSEVLRIKVMSGTLMGWMRLIGWDWRWSDEMINQRLHYYVWRGYVSNN